MHGHTFEPLEKRTYKFKNPHMEFFCPLCGTQRAMTTNPHLTGKNYLQIILITMAVSACLYPLMELKGIFSFFVVWGAFEAALRVNFRKEVPCPHCGFDASWYKKDVKVARQKVDEFWKTRTPDPSVGGHATHTHQTEDVLDEVAAQM